MQEQWQQKTYSMMILVEMRVQLGEGNRKKKKKLLLLLCKRNAWSSILFEGMAEILLQVTPPYSGS